MDGNIRIIFMEISKNSRNVTLLVSTDKSYSQSSGYPAGSNISEPSGFTQLADNFFCLFQVNLSGRG